MLFAKNKNCIVSYKKVFMKTKHVKIFGSCFSTITEFKSSLEAPLSTSNPSLKQGWRSSTPLEINLCPISNYTTRLFQPYFKPGPKFQTLSQPTINHLEKTKKLNESSLLP